VSDTILLSKREAARTLSISVRTLDSLIATSVLPARRIGRRVLIARWHLEQFAIGKGLRRQHPHRVQPQSGGQVREVTA
jgi:excisionase family DNA binding protein